MKKSPFKLTKPLYPILNYGLLSDGILTYTNLDVYACYNVVVSSDIDPVCLSAADISRALRVDKFAQLSACGSKIEATGIELPIATLPASDFPRYPVFDAPLTEHWIEGFAAGVKKVLYAAANNDCRHYLNGVCMEVNNGVSTLIAADGCRLEYVQLSKTTSLANGQYIIPTCAAHLIDCDTVAGPGKRIDDNSLWLRCGNITFKLIEGRFPDWRRVVPLPEQRPLHYTIDRDIALRTIKQIIAALPAPSKRKAPRTVEIVFGDKRVQLLAIWLEDARPQWSIPCKSTSPELTMKVDLTLLAEAIKNRPAGSVTIRCAADGNSSLLIGASCVLMPIRR